MRLLNVNGNKSMYMDMIIIMRFNNFFNLTIIYCLEKLYFSKSVNRKYIF